MMEPRYRDIASSDIPEVKTDTGAMVKVIAGEVEGQVGPAKDIVIEPQYLDIGIRKKGSFRQGVRLGHTVFAFIYEGDGMFSPSSKETYGSGTLVLFSDGEDIEIHNPGSSTLRFLLVSGKPLREPIAWRGPIVMNTEDELRKAFDEYHKGTFLKVE